MTIFGMGAGPHQKQTAQSETLQAAEHTLFASGFFLLSVTLAVAEVLLIGRMAGPLILAATSVAAPEATRTKKARGALVFCIALGMLLSYAGIYGPWPAFAITWEFWPWVQLPMLLSVPVIITFIMTQIERQVTESLFPNLLNSVRAQPGRIVRGTPVSQIAYTDDEDGGGGSPHVTWSS